MNLQSWDEFVDLEHDLLDEVTFVHIKVQSSRGRKKLTTCSGIPAEINLPKLLKALKKEFATNGLIREHSEHGKIIQLQGDQREVLRSFLVRESIVPSSKTQTHGY